MNDVTVNVAQQERNNNKCYALAFSNTQSHSHYSIMVHKCVGKS